MTTRIAKGTASLKALGSTLTLADVAVNEDAALVVALGYDDALGHPTSVKWGNREFKRRRARNPATYDIASSVWTIGSIRDTATKDIVVTWSGNINERAMVATSIEGANKIDQAVGNNEDAITSSPVTGVCDELTEAKGFGLGFFVSEGPDNNDTVGTPEVSVGGSWVPASLGQRIGTNGAPVLGNVTITEVYHSLETCAPTEMRLTGATARKWTGMLIVMETLSVYLIYYSRGKCILCDTVLWTTNRINPVACECGDVVLHPDGTGNAVACTDLEIEAAARTGIPSGTYDDIELVEI